MQELLKEELSRLQGLPTVVEDLKSALSYKEKQLHDLAVHKQTLEMTTKKNLEVKKSARRILNPLKIKDQTIALLNDRISKSMKNEEQLHQRNLMIERRLQEPKQSQVSIISLHVKF